MTGQSLAVPERHQRRMTHLRVVQRLIHRATMPKVTQPRPGWCAIQPDPSGENLIQNSTSSAHAAFARPAWQSADRRSVLPADRREEGTQLPLLIDAP